MVCGYALGHYLEHQILMDLHTLNKSLAITDKEICLYEPNAFASHLMLDSEEVYQMTKRKMDAAQIADAKRIHINLVLVKLLELHHLGYDLRHYHAQHHAFIEQLNLPEYYRFDSRNNLLTDTIIFNCFVILCTAHMMTCSIVASHITTILCHSGA